MNTSDTTNEKNDLTIANAGVHSQIQIEQRQQDLQRNKSKLIDYISSNVIGSHLNTQLKTVFGLKPHVYVDYTASGKSLAFIEDYLRDNIMPLYANTHSMQSASGKQSVFAREEARHVIKQYLNATENDALIFVGNGATSASNLLINKLKLKEISQQVRLKEKIQEALPEEQVSKILGDDQEATEISYCKQNRWMSYDCTLCKVILPSLGAYEQHATTELHKRAVQLQTKTTHTQVPVVFTSVFEHNSNLLPWKESGVQIEMIPMTDDGDLDYLYLEEKLKSYKDQNRLKIGAFSAGSNITGTIFDVDRIAVACHLNKALAVFDYAAVAPYVQINMNGTVENSKFKYKIAEQDLKYCYKDAVFLSPHKFVGGPGSSGILVAKKNLLFDRKPDRVGGGPIFFVNELDHEFVANTEELEEAGTPGIIQDIRAALAFQLKDQLSVQTIQQRDDIILQKVLPRLLNIENLFLLGNNSLPKVPIFTFIIKSRFGKILHPHFVTSLLNDLFGIQTRSGCSCSAIYGQKILGIDLQMSRQYKDALFEGHELMRMGFTRFNLPYFFTDNEIDFVINSIEFVCKFGWMFLPNYKFNVDLGIWVSREEKEQQQRVWLGEVDYSKGFFQNKIIAGRDQKPFNVQPQPENVDFNYYLQLAKQHLVDTVISYKTNFGKSGIDQLQLVPDELKHLVWWVFPSQVQSELQSLKNVDFEMLSVLSEGKQSGNFTTPFKPKDYNRAKFKFEFSREYINQPEESYPNKPEEQINVVEETKESSETPNQQENQIDEGFVFEDFCDEVIPKVQKQKKAKLIKVPLNILSLVGSAIRDFQMIKDGDKVLVALSGGKDSLALVHILRHFQSVAPIKFDIGAVTIDPMVIEYQPRPLIGYMASLGVPYFLESDALVERARLSMQKNSICSFCSRMKRGMIYTCARREGYNVIAMGQHLDDLAESFVMSSFHNGQLRTMKANYTIDKGDLRVIRPLVTCREKLFKDFSDSVKLPVISDNCPACFSAPKERHRIKLMLAQQENLFPDLFQSILKTILPLMRCNVKDLIKLGADDSDEEAEAALAKTCDPNAGASCPFMV